METVDGFCCLGDRLSFSGDCEAAVTATVRIVWVKFREGEELLLGNRFPLRKKGKVYRCCLRSAIPYKSVAWCFKENKKAILRRMDLRNMLEVLKLWLKVTLCTVEHEVTKQLPCSIVHGVAW